MKKLDMERVENVLGGVLEEAYEGDFEEYKEWLSDIRDSLDGETYIGEGRNIPFGSGMNYTIYSDEEPIHIWVDSNIEYSEDGNPEEEVFTFGRYKK